MEQSITGAWIAGAVMVALSLGVLTLVDRADGQAAFTMPTLAHGSETLGSETPGSEVLGSDFVEIIIDDEAGDADHLAIRPVAVPSM